MESESESKEEIGTTAPPTVPLSLRDEPEIAKNLLGLVANEVGLELHELNPQISERLRSTYEELLVQLRVELRRMEKLKLEAAQQEQLGTLEGRVRELIGRVVKLK
jgi:hypothetical protein